MTEVMYYVYSKVTGHLITKTTNLKDLEKFLPDLVQVVVVWVG